MADDGPPLTPKCVFLEEKSGMKFYELKKTLLLPYDPKIKIISIGDENDFDTRNIIMMGETGAGKTRLLNALVNHLFGVKFEDNYRYFLKDETGDVSKRKAESQTEYVVGYLIYVPPGSNGEFNYMIIDTPGLKDSKGEERELEVHLQIKTFLQDVDGVDEFHCIGFVVNGTLSRIHKHFKDIVEEFCKMFGENAKEIIRTLISFSNKKRPPVIDVLECSCLKDCKTCKFDNGDLYECNQPIEDYSEEDIRTSKILWRKTATTYNSFFNAINNINAVSLGLTREALTEISNLNDTINRFKQLVETYLDVTVDYKQCEDKCKEYQMIMKSNEQWKGTVTVKERRRFLGIVVSPKHVQHSVVYEDKKKLYDEAKNNESSIKVQIVSLQQQINEEKSKVNENAQKIVQHLDKIKEHSLSYRDNTPQESIDQTLEQIKIERLSQTTDTQRHMYVSPILDSLSKDIYASIGSPNQ